MEISEAQVEKEGGAASPGAPFDLARSGPGFDQTLSPHHAKAIDIAGMARDTVSARCAI